MNHSMLALAISLFIVFNVGFSIFFYYKRLRTRAKKSYASFKKLVAHERRRTLRSALPLKVFVRKRVTGDIYASTDFKTKDFSHGGLYIFTSEPAPLFPGDEISLIADYGSLNYYKGRARVVHSEAVFNDESIRMESGFGLMFLTKPNESVKLG